ncbi:MAG: ABC transporter ATP-binding protein [Bacilli bacterium]|nr:ABC transporter ATP-binding protein [Bacilli bacterium]MDD4808565.1 ABC transporter ATP-binding protein [Bacilli bacterium]
MLKIEKLTKYYKDILGIEDLSLDIKKGEIFGFIGPNGAGKSTTIKCILNLINKTSGSIYMDGQELTKDNYQLKEMIGYLPSEVDLYDDFTVKEMLDYSASFYQKDISKRTKYLVKKLDLDLTKKIDELSFGNIKKLGIVLALMHEPKLLVLDEPTSGLDPLKQEVFFELMEEEKEKGTTIFFSSHNLNEVRRICDSVAIIKNGHLVETLKIAKLNKFDFNLISLYSKEYKKLKLPMKDIIIKKQSDEMIQFIYQKDINSLLDFLNTIKIDNLLIEKPSLEEIFFHYYKED